MPDEINVKQAVSIALAYVRDIYEETPDDVLLEEVEHVQAGQPSWKMTVSFHRSDTVPVGNRFINDALGIPASKPRHYKMVEVDNFGVVLAMRMKRLPES